MMKINALTRLLLTGLVALCVFAAFPSASRAVTDEEIASIGLNADTATTATVHKADPAAPPTVTGILGRLAVALGVVFALMAGVLWIARRYFPQSIKSTGRGAAIDILASRTLGQRRQLLVVRARGKTVLLGVTPQAIQCLTELDDETLAWDEAAAGAGLAAGMNPASPSGLESPGTTGMGDL